MKYMQSGSFKSNSLMRLTLLASLVFLIAFWITTFFMYFSRMGLTPESVTAYYLGSEAAFTMPRTAGTMLEVTHGHLPVMAMVALLLTHLFIFTPLSQKIKSATIVVLFASAFLGEAASWLVRFVHPDFAWLKIVSFATLQVSMGLVIFGLFAMLVMPPRASGNGKMHSTTSPQPERLARRPVSRRQRTSVGDPQL